MSACQGHPDPVPVRYTGVICILVFANLYHPSTGPWLCVYGAVVGPVERRATFNQLLTAEQLTNAVETHPLGHLSICRKTATSEKATGRAAHLVGWEAETPKTPVEGTAGNATHSFTSDMADKEDGERSKPGHNGFILTDTERVEATPLALSCVNPSRHRQSTQCTKTKRCNPFLSKPERQPGGKIRCPRGIGNIVKRNNDEAWHPWNLGHEKQQQQQPSQMQHEEQPRSQQSNSGQQHEHISTPKLQDQQRPRLLSSSETPTPVVNHASDNAAIGKYKVETPYEVATGGSRGKDRPLKEAEKKNKKKELVGRFERLATKAAGNSQRLQALNELAESFVKETSPEAILENEWSLIEDSWRRMDLLYSNATAFSENGFRVYQQDDGRSYIQAVVPFWKVDMLGALHDLAKMAAWQAVGIPAPSAARPLRLQTGRGATEPFVEINYSPASERNTYTIGWNDTQIVYSTGVDPTDVWNIGKIGGNTTETPTGHMMEITSTNATSRAFHDLSSRFYGHEINARDVGVNIRHQFHDDDYDATPSNVVVQSQNYTVDIGADPTDANYRVGIGTQERNIALSRDFDERKTAFTGNIGDWQVSWDSDAQDANSSAFSAGAEIGRNEEPILTARLRRGDDGSSTEGDAQVQMRDMGMRMQLNEDGLTGDVTLGNIKYRISMREGLPDFTLTAA